MGRHSLLPRLSLPPLPPSQPWKARKTLPTLQGAPPASPNKAPGPPTQQPPRPLVRHSPPKITYEYLLLPHSATQYHCTDPSPFPRTGTGTSTYRHPAGPYCSSSLFPLSISTDLVSLQVLPLPFLLSSPPLSILTTSSIYDLTLQRYRARRHPRHPSTTYPQQHTHTSPPGYTQLASALHIPGLVQVQRRQPCRPQSPRRSRRPRAPRLMAPPTTSPSVEEALATPPRCTLPTPP